MHLIRQGIFRSHGWKSLFREADKVRVQFAQRNVGPRITIGVRAIRAGQESSYQYEMVLSPEEVLRCLLTLPPSAIGEAVGKVEGFNIAEAVPEVVKHLTAGAIAAVPRPKRSEEEELEEDTDDDDGEPAAEG